MKKIIIFTLGVMAFWALAFAMAKPKPPTPDPTPYLPPVVEALAYPAPIPTIAAPVAPDIYSQLIAHNPTADPIPGIPYVWGYFTVTTTSGRTIHAVWVTLQGVGDVQYAGDGMVCMRIIGDPPTRQNCKILMPYEYKQNIDMNVFYSPFYNYCHTWFEVASVHLNSTYGTWRTPNEYFQFCVYVPTQPRWN